MVLFRTENEPSKMHNVRPYVYSRPCDDPFKALKEELSELRKADSMLIPVEITAAELVGTDSDLITTEAPTTDKEIMESVNLEEDGIHDEENDNDGGEEICDDPVVKPTVYEVSSALEVLKNACLFSIKGHEMQRVLQQFESLYGNEQKANWYYVLLSGKIKW